MIIYTTVPLEKVFEDMEHTPQLTEMEIEGVTMLVQQQGPDQGKIVRLISSDPNHYLQSRYMPGQKIYFRPELKG